ncbi:MAG: signal peptidase II [Bacilli bacterium]|nr:signal peptidase II [Bacilli bacterium]
MKKVLDFIKKYKHYFLAFGIVACFVAADQITKYVVRQNVELGLYPGIKVINNFFYITYSINTGAMNGILTGNKAILIIITLIALVIFGFFAKDINFMKKRLYSWSVCLIIAGTLGNFIDRLFLNGVTDFLSFYPLGKGHDWFISWISLDPWPTFNIADSLLVIGVIALVIYLLFFDKELFQKKDKDKPAVPADELKEEETDGTN